MPPCAAAYFVIFAIDICCLRLLTVFAAYYSVICLPCRYAAFATPDDVCHDIYLYSAVFHFCRYAAIFFFFDLICRRYFFFMLTFFHGATCHTLLLFIAALIRSLTRHRRLRCRHATLYGYVITIRHTLRPCLIRCLLA